MSKRTNIYRFATCGALGLASCVGLTGCGESDYSQYVQDVAFEAESATEAEQQALVDQLLLGAASTANFAGAATGAVPTFAFAGATGAAPTFSFANAGTTGAAPAFTFANAGTTGDAPVFNFGSAATTGDAPVFNFGSAATTGDAPVFNFGATATPAPTAAKPAVAKLPKKPTYDFAATQAVVEAENKAAEQQAAAEKAEAERKAAEAKAAEADKARQAAEAKAAEADAARKAAEAKAAEPAPAEEPAPENTVAAFFFSELNAEYSAEVESRLPSVANLESALDATIAKLKRDVEDLELIPSFEDGSVGLYRDANALAAVALALGMSTEDSPAKAAAPALLEAAQAAASAKNLEEAQAAMKAIEAARTSKGSTDALRWDQKVVALRPLMKNAVPALTTEMKRLGRNEKTFLRRGNAKKTIDNSTVLAALALACRENVDETLAPEEDELWREYCERLAAAATDYNEKANAAAAGQGDFAETLAALKTVEATCNATCHEKFGGKAAE